MAFAERLKADASKQVIQQELARMGYPQFSKMSGFKGDEKAKRDAMKTIYNAIISYSNAASTITGYLEGGNITPATVQKVKIRFPQNKAAQDSENLTSIQIIDRIIDEAAPIENDEKVTSLPQRPAPVNCDDYKGKGLTAAEVPPQCLELAKNMQGKKVTTTSTNSGKTTSTSTPKQTSSALKTIQSGFGTALKNKYVRWTGTAFLLGGIAYGTYKLNS